MADEARIDDLYGLPLEAFIKARDELAAELRSAGEKERAGEVKKLKKPSLAAWAVNQVAQNNREDIERLFELRERVEQATDAKAMRAASEERRRAIAALVAKAENALEKGGHATGANTMQAITQTLQAGDDDKERDALIRGRLTRELIPSGFGGGFAFAPEDAAEPEADPKIEEKRAKADRLETEAAEAEREAMRLEDEAAAAERAWRKATAAAEAARRSADEAARSATRARKDLS